MCFSLLSDRLFSFDGDSFLFCVRACVRACVCVCALVNIVCGISGGALGGTAAAYSAHGKFESVGSVIRRMDDEKRKMLFERAVIIFRKFSVTDIVTLNALMAGEMAFRSDLIGVVIEHLHDNLSLDVVK